LEPFVNFAPSVPRDQLPSLYQQADVFCFPTLCDTYGIALLEAMSCGCAVIVTDVAGAGEIVNGENGLKVRLNSPEQYIWEYAEKIVILARNHELRKSLCDTARRYILREHDWNRIGKQVLAVYDELGCKDQQ
jgi:glycosyltransferase involved in cell wall biosynthesis